MHWLTANLDEKNSRWGSFWGVSGKAARSGNICVSPGRESLRENCFCNERVVQSRPGSSPKGGIWVSPARKRRVRLRRWQ